MNYLLIIGMVTAGLGTLVGKQEPVAPKQETKNVQVELVSIRPPTKNGWSIFLSIEGLVDLKGHRIDETEFRRILRLTKINDARKECVVFVNIDKKDAKRISVLAIANVMRQIEMAGDPDIPTYVYVVLPRP